MKKFECSTSFTNYIHSPGDVSLCIICGEASIFDDKLRLREPTKEEREQIDKNPDVIKHRVVLKEFKKEKGG